LAGLTFLAGDPLMPLVALFVALLAVGFPAFGHRPPGWHRLMWTAAAALLGALLTCLPILYEGYLLFPFTYRSLRYIAFEALTSSLHPLRLIDVVLPGSLPLPQDPRYPFPWTRYGFSWEAWYPSLGVGLLATVTWILGLVSWSRQKGGLVSLGL